MFLRGFWALGKGGGAQHLVFYCGFGPWERAVEPKTSYFTMVLGPGKGRWGPTPRILRRVWVLGKGGGPQNLVFYDDFGPWERAVGPKTSWFTMVLGPGKGRWSPTPRILRRFWALGKGDGTQNLVFYVGPGPWERAAGPNTSYFTRFLGPGPTNGKPPKTAQSGPKPTDFDHFLSFRALSGG